MKKVRIATLCIAAAVLMGQTALAGGGPEVKNFMTSPEGAIETFEDESVLQDGKLSASFLELSDGAKGSSIQTDENGNRFFALTDTDYEGKQTYAVITIKPVSDVANDKGVLSFDFCLPTPDNEKANSQDSSGEYLRFYALGADNSTGNQAYALQFNLTCANPDGANRGKYVFNRYDGSGSGWFGNLAVYNVWYTVRYEFNLENHTYNAYLYNRDTGALVISDIGRSLKTSDSANPTSSSDYRLTHFTFQVNARNNGAPMSMYFDNIAVAHEQFYVSEPPVITAEGDVITASAAVGNQSFDKLKSPVLCLAVYDSERRLVSAAYDAVEAEGKTAGKEKRYAAANLSCTLKKPVLGEGYTAEAVVLTAMDNAKPYTRSAVLELQ